MVDLHKKEHAFGAFTIGVAVGVGAALLFGTEDGRKLAQKLFDSLPEKIKNLKDESVIASDLSADARAQHLQAGARQSPTAEPFNTLLSNPESTPHTATYTPTPPTF